MGLNLNREGVALNAEARNKRNENWGKIEVGILNVEEGNEANGALATLAKLAADDAKVKALEAKAEVANAQQQINTLVVAGDSSPQAQQASVGADGTSYEGNLKARLDAEYNQTAAQLADTVKLDDTGVLDLNIFDEPTRSAIQGVAPGTINAVLGKGNVKAENTDFLSIRNLNLFNKDDPGNESGIVTSTGVVANASFTASHFIPVEAGKIYNRDVNDTSIIYDANKVYKRAVTSSKPNAILMETGDRYIRINIANSALAKTMFSEGALPAVFQVFGAKEIKSEPFETLIKNLVPLVESKWSNKKWLVIGDSITESNFRTTKNYHGYIADRIKCTVQNYGFSGTGWRTPNTSGNSLPVYQRIDSYPLDADLITVFAGTNDWGQTGTPFVLGSFGDTNPASNFYGAIDYAIKNLVAKYPTKTIAVFTPLQRSNGFTANSAGVTMEQVADAIINVAYRYGIPVLDLYRNNNLNVWNEISNAHYFTAPTLTLPDGLHPNDNGHKVLADKIFTFLNSL